MKRSNILVLGYFGYTTNQLDGQTIKTRSLLSLLEEKGIICDFFDTQNFQYNKTSFVTLIKKIVKSKIVFYVPAHNNLKYLFPILFVISKIFRIKIYYFVVGGWLVEFLKKRPLHRHFLSKISMILPETQYMINQLSIEYKFNNLTLFPNFRLKNENDINVLQMQSNTSDILKLVFMSRVIMEKGLGVIDALCLYLETKVNSNNIKIDFYGPISEKDEKFFLELIANYSFINYKGVLQPIDIVKILQTYDALLLPTRYYTEGLPGAIVDAYMAGIPVIVTEWKHSHEFVKHLETGFIVPFDNPNDEFIDSVMRLYQDRNLLLKMKKNAFYESFNYSDKYAWDILKSISKF